MTGLRSVCRCQIRVRTQYANVTGQFSEEIAVMSGIPQWSVLGPTLFIYFINDMPEFLKCFDPFVKIFADDTTLIVDTN